MEQENNISFENNNLESNNVETQNVYNSTQTTKIKGKKGKIILIIALIIALLAGTYFVFGDKIFGYKNSPKDVAKRYVDNLIDKKYEENYELIKLEENSFVDVNDYMKYAYSVKEYEKILGNKKYEINEKSLTTVDGSYEFKFENNNVVLNINVVKNKDGKWKVIDGDFVKPWIYNIPVGTKVYINGNELSQDFMKESSKLDKDHLMVEIPEIGLSEKEIKLEHELGTSTIKVIPSSKNNQELFEIELKDTKELDKIYEYIKTSWNSMFKDYKDKVSIEDIKNKYFDESVSIEDVQLYIKSFDELISSSTPSINYENMNMVKVIPSSEKISYVYGKDTILVNFGYQLKWTFIYLSDDMNRYSSIILRKVDDTYKIYKVSDIKLFNYINSFTHDFR